jgi:histidyl-tRNA synthetase
MSKHELSTESYKGVRDFYPSDWAQLSSIFDTIRGVLTARGYEEYAASPLELSELYESKGNEEMVNEQTYSFEDRGGRKVTLRPEMTPTFARMVAHKRRELPFPLRWFSIPNLFRYERPQRGRLREHFQINVDLAGVANKNADFEMLDIVQNIFKAFGATDKDFIIRVNNRKLLMSACTAAGCDTPEKAREYLRLLDRKAKISHEDYVTALAEIIPHDPLQIIRDGSNPEVQAAKEEIEAFILTVEERGVTSVLFDPTLARGFDYYTDMIFEAFDTNPENPRSICGGGRYDELVTLFGGDPIPCIGFGLGDVTFQDFLETHNLLSQVAPAADVFIGTPSPTDQDAALVFADALRQTGIRTFMNLTEKSLGDQVRDAVKRRIPYFIAFGESEKDSGKVKIKELATSSETEVPFAGVASHVRPL